MLDIKLTDLRTRTPIEREKMIVTVKRAMADLGSQKKVAETLKINRRTVAKYLHAPDPTLRYSELNNLVASLLERIAHSGINTACTEFYYTPKINNKEYKYQIAVARQKLMNYIDVDQLLGEERSLQKRLCHLNQLVKNKVTFQVLMHGVLLKTDDFLADNLNFFKSLAINHPDLEPKELLNEANFCLWFLFGHQSSHKWLSTINTDHLRWHMHTARQAQK